MLKRILILIAGLLLIGLLSPRLITYAQQPKVITAASISDVNIRAFPGLNAGVIGVLPNNAKANVIGRTSGNNWVQVEYSGTKGWIAGWLLYYSADPISIPITTDTQPDSASVASTTAYAPRNVNIRSSNNPNASILGMITYNSEAKITARSADSSWVQVDFGGKKGWAARWLLILRADVNGLPVGVGSSSPSPTATPGPSPTPRPGTTPAPGSPTGITITAPFRVNIRSAPGSASSALGMLSPGATASALGRNVGNNWIQIQSGNTTGWVAAWVVVKSDDTAALPQVSDFNETAVNPGNAVLTGKGITTVIIRSFPGVNYGSVGDIPAGTPATLTARTADSSWIKVNYNGVEGWVAAWVITGSNDFNILPIIEF